MFKQVDSTGLQDLHFWHGSESGLQAIIAGSANNHRADEHSGEALYRRGIRYVSDYRLNTGGLIFVARNHSGQKNTAIQQKIPQTDDALSELYLHADADKQPSVISDIRAEMIIRQACLVKQQPA